jgi:diacylglycerol kinase family enzyme
MAVANGRYFGNALCVAPDARLADGKFQITLFGDLSVWDYLKNLGKLKKGVRIDHPEVTYHNAEEVLLESTVPCPIEADGEFVGLTPATVRVLPAAICFLMPPEAESLLELLKTEGQ